MSRRAKLFIASATFLVGLALPWSSNSVEANAAQGFEAIRSIQADVCLPATPEEYQGLGKNAIIMLSAHSAISTELPLQSVFVEYLGVEVPLQHVGSLPVARSADGSGVEIAFYLVPVRFLKTDARLLADFSGNRSDFSILSFGEDFLAGAPAFARLDEYDRPSNPDMAVVGAVLKREYADYF